MAARRMDEHIKSHEAKATAMLDILTRLRDARELKHRNEGNH